jgi:hypothetical protein
MEGDHIAMFDGIPLNDLTAPTLVGIAVLLVMLGGLVPRWLYKAKEQECQRWQKAYEAERDARKTSESQSAELLEFAKATYHILDALFVNTEYSQQSGGAHRVVPTKR